MPSVKNLQLVNAEQDNVVAIQFGRIEDEKFTLDYLNPFSAIQAFGLALAAFDYSPH